jgi:hypothetical protein
MPRLKKLITVACKTNSLKVKYVATFLIGIRWVLCCNLLRCSDEVVKTEKPDIPEVKYTTIWSRISPDKLIVTQLVKKLPASHETQRFITVFARTCH